MPNIEPYNTDLLPMRQGVNLDLVHRAGKETFKSFLEFFFADIRNENTCGAYGRAVGQFLNWCAGHGLELLDIKPLHAAAYIELLTKTRKPSTVKQHRAALVRLFDYLVEKPGPASFNPIRPVRGPRFSSTRGNTEGMSVDEVNRLFASIPTGSLVGHRDRALIGTMLYSCARVSAVIGMKVKDYFENDMGSRSFRLHEKGGKEHVVPAHHKAQEYLSAYLKSSGLTNKEDWLFPSANRQRGLTTNKMHRNNVWNMIKRRCNQAGIRNAITTHSMRVTGANALLEAGVPIETVQHLMNHADPRTTKVYDRRQDKIDQGDIERMRFEITPSV